MEDVKYEKYRCTAVRARVMCDGAVSIPPREPLRQFTKNMSTTEKMAFLEKLEDAYRRREITKLQFDYAVSMLEGSKK
jgi:hypothetical protein